MRPSGPVATLEAALVDVKVTVFVRSVSLAPTGGGLTRTAVRASETRLDLRARPAPGGWPSIVRRSRHRGRRLVRTVEIRAERGSRLRR